MFEHFFSSENVPFAAAIVMMVGLGVLEGLGLFFGTGISHLLDSLIPDLDANVDVGADASTAVDAAHGPTPGLVSHILGWLRVGQVPLLILLVWFLFCFGILGLGLQALLFAVAGFMLPGWLAALPVLVACLPLVRGFGGLVGRLMPKDDTQAVGLDTFVGRIAVVVLGTAKEGEAAQARLTDRFGRAHYVRVEPDAQDLEFPQGTEVLLVKREGALFRAIKNPSPILTDSHKEN